MDNMTDREFSEFVRETTDEMSKINNELRAMNNWAWALFIFCMTLAMCLGMQWTGWVNWHQQINLAIYGG